MARRGAALVLLAAVLVCCAAVGPSDERPRSIGIQPGEVDTRPYGELALKTVEGLDAVMTALAAFDDSTPPEGGKDLRAAITQFRDYIDLFAFAYPYTPGRPDTWAQIRAALNKGHSCVGAFKDLFDSGVPYTPEEASQARAAVLEWKEDVLERQPAWRAFLGLPFRTVLFYRPDDDLSRKAWWGACRATPDLRWTGLQNIALLERLSLERAVTLMKLAISLPRETLLEEDSITTYHNFRKGMRSIINISTYFPGILGGPQATAPLDTTKSAYERLGAIMDKVSEYRWQSMHGLDTTDVAADVLSQWDALLAWIGQVGLSDVFAALAAALIM